MPFKLIVKNSKVVLKTVANYILNVSGIKDLLDGSSDVDSNGKIDWTLQHFTDTAANFTSNNPILLVGQLGVETDDLLTSPKIKVGDGTTAWNSLPYLSSGSSGNFVPYTGASQDVDLGTYSLNGKSLHIKGTGGNGHLGLKHQSSNITANASESSLGADSSGNPVWKNDGNAIESIELQTNKTSTVTGNETSTSKYLTVKGVYDWVTGLFVKKGTLTANTIPKATASDTIGNSSITDTGILVTVNNSFYATNGNAEVSAQSTSAYLSADQQNYTNIETNLTENVLLHNVKNTFNAPANNFPHLTVSQLIATDASKNLQSLDVATYPSLTELSYVKGVTSAIQTQLNNKVSVESMVLNPGATLNPADATTYYFGSFISTAATTTAAARRVYLGKDCTILGATFSLLVSGTVGSAEDINVYIRVNNTTDYSIGTIKANTGTQQVLINSSMSVTLTSTDYIEIKMLMPTFATNPTNVSFTSVINVR